MNTRRCVVVGITLASSGSAGGQGLSPESSRLFDHADREARAFVGTMRCMQSLLRLRKQGAFGPALVREVDAFADYRPIAVPDTGVVVIVSNQDFVPTLTDMALANMATDARRRFRLDMRRITATLAGGGAQAIWIQRKRP